MFGPRSRSLAHRRFHLGAAGAVLVALVVVVVALAGPLARAAGAHASVTEVTPGAGEALSESPSVVKVTFSEGVDIGRDAMTLFDGSGERVPVGSLRQPSPNRLVLPIGEKLPDGAYIVTWRGISEDTHSISGTWTFRVGDAPVAGGDVDALASRLLADQQADRVVAVGWGIARGTVFASLALLVGGVVFAALVWPRARDSRRTRRLVMAGWVALLASTVLGVLFFGAYSQGGSLRDIVDLDVLRDTLDTRFGTVWLARVILLVGALVLVRVMFARRPAVEYPLPGWWYAGAAVVGGALVCTPGLAGHASTGDHRALALAVDAVHVAAMAVWLGGLAVLAAVVMPRRDVDELRVVVPRFSRVALACVVALVATGVVHSWRLVGGLDALRDSEFGRVLVVKLVVFALLLVAATLSRELVGRLVPIPAREEYARTGPDRVKVPVVRGGAVDEGAPAGPDRRTARELTALRRSVWAEVALGAAVLAVTALLVNAAPPADSATTSVGAQGVTLRDPAVVVDITATPGEAGLNDLHVYTFTPGGAPLDVDAVELTLAQPQKAIAPLDAPLRELAPNHFFSPGLDIPLTGPWKVVVTARLGPVDRVDLTGTLAIR
jgi:copper transport protein